MAVRAKLTRANSLESCIFGEVLDVDEAWSEIDCACNGWRRSSSDGRLRRERLRRRTVL